MILDHEMRPKLTILNWRRQQGMQFKNTMIDFYISELNTPKKERKKKDKNMGGHRSHCGKTTA